MHFLANLCVVSYSLVIYLQVRSPTGVHGKAASGALHEAMSSPDTSGSTLEQSHSNAVTATGECADKCIFTMARAAFHELIKKNGSRGSRGFINVLLKQRKVNYYLISGVLREINSHTPKGKQQSPFLFSAVLSSPWQQRPPLMDAN